MNIPVKTLKSGFSLPVYGLGTWRVGGRTEPDHSNDEAEVAAIKAAINHGITHIDTAELYGGGHTEELVGQAIRGVDRSQLILTTKVSAWNQAYDDLLKSCQNSLKRLGTDYIDLYLLHRYPEPGIPIQDTMRAMDKLVSKGLVKNIGVCNLTNRRFEEAQKHSTNKLVCNQLHYSLQGREPEVKGIIKYCQDNDIFVTAWGPLEKGALENAQILNAMAKKYHKTPYQIAINWLMSQKNVIAIPKTTNIQHLEENLGAIGWEPSVEDLQKLTKEFPNQKQISDRVPLNYEADIEP
jgi:diketogulonate reductase-like aldo/keto reductase